MFIYKKLKSSDAGILAFEAHKTYSQDNATFTLADSKYSTANKDTYSLKDNDPNNHKKFFQLDHLFYRDAPFKLGSLNGGLNYVNQVKHLFEDVKIVSLTHKDIGNGIQKGTLTVGSYKDDKKGNLYIGDTDLSLYPKEKDRALYLGPVDGYRHKDLTVNLGTNLPLVNYPTYYSNIEHDDSIFTNKVEYVNCTIEDMSGDLAGFTGINLNDGYVKVAHSNNFNFGDQDFTICFWYDPEDTSGVKYILSKAFTKTIESTPTFPNLTKDSGSAQFGPQNVDAGPSTPFSIIANGTKLSFIRKSPDKKTSITTTLSGGLTHYTFVKRGTTIEIYKNGVSQTTGTDTVTACKNKADLFIGSNGANRPDTPTAGGLISQINVFSTSLTDAQVTKLYESKTGSPFVGNVFYEQGIITITRPDQTRSGFTTLASQTANISLQASNFNATIEGAGISEDVITFKSNVAFFNEEAIVFGAGFIGDLRSVKTEVETQINANSQLEFETNTGAGTNYSLGIKSTPSGGHGDTFTAAPIFSSSLHELAPFSGLSQVGLIGGEDFVSGLYQFEAFEDLELNSIVGGTGVTVGEGSARTLVKKVDLNFPNGGIAAGRALSLRNNKLITASFNIEPPNSTVHFEEDWLVYFSGGDYYQPLNNTIFDDQSAFNLDSSANVAIKGKNDLSTSTNTDGLILATGSKGDKPCFGYQGMPYTRLIVDENTTNVYYGAGQQFQLIDSNNSGRINLGNFNEQAPVNITTTTGDYGTGYGGIFNLQTNTTDAGSTVNEGAYFRSTISGVADCRDGKLYLGYGITSGYVDMPSPLAGQKILYEAPDTIFPYVKIRGLRKAANATYPQNTPTIRPKYRINGGDYVYTNWVLPGGGPVDPQFGFNINHTSTQDRVFFNKLSTSGLNQGDYIEFAFDVSSTGGAAGVNITGDIYFGLNNGFETYGFAPSSLNFATSNDTTITGPSIPCKINIASDLFDITSDPNTDNIIKFEMSGSITGTDDGGNQFTIGPAIDLKRYKGSAGDITLIENPDAFGSSYGHQRQYNVFESSNLRVTVFLEIGKGNSFVDPIILDKITSDKDGDLGKLDNKIFLKGNTLNRGGEYDKVRVRIALTDPSGNVVHTRATQGMVLGNNRDGLATLVEHISKDNFNIVGTSINADSTLIDTQDLSVLFGQNKETLDQSTLTDGGSFNQSMSFDNINYIQEGEVPELITSMSNAGTVSNTFGDVIHLTSPILITSSIGVTASYEAGAIVSASYQLPSNLEKGLYEVTKLIINTNEDQAGAVPNNIPDIAPNAHVSVAAYVNGTLIDTKQTPTLNGRIDLCEQSSDRIRFGLYHSDTNTSGTDTASFQVFTSNPSDATDPVEVRKGQGLVVERIELTRITSSNELKLEDGTSFSEHLGSLDPNDATEVRFKSPHVDRGIVAFPFTFESNTPGDHFTASIDSFDSEFNTAFLDTHYLITTSFEGAGSDEQAQLFKAGPFPISAHFDFTIPSYSNITNELEYEYTANNHASDRNASLYQFNLPASFIGQTYFIGHTSLGNTGQAIRIYKGHNSNRSNVIAEIYSDGNTNIGSLNNSNLNDQLGELHPNNISSDSKYRIQFFLSGADSPDYPEGVITGSDSDVILNVNSFYISGKKLSGSKISDIDPGTWNGTTKIQLTSSHEGSLPHSLLTTGNQIITNAVEGASGKIQVSDVLFITASSVVTGSKTQLSTGEEVFSYTPWPNSAVPINNVTEDLLGGTFTYGNINYTITSILGTENENGFDLIELNNGVGSLTTTLNDDSINQPQNAEVTYFTVQNSSGFTMGFKNTHLIFENEFHCTVDESEFNHTLNTTTRKFRSAEHGELADFATGSKFRPYVTTIGLYNDEGELLVVGKLAQPVKTSTETDTTFVVRYDT